MTNIFGHGLGGEVLPSIMIEDQEVNLSIGILHQFMMINILNKMFH